ncbi:MAG TPA: hypothetical protein VN809_00200 [Telmatospirillum sp.]|nr:hypothetical protein [Telmatospirillum sp.]
MAPTIACVASKVASPFASLDGVDVVPDAVVADALSLLPFPVLDEDFDAGDAIGGVLADDVAPFADEVAVSCDVVRRSSVEELGFATVAFCGGEVSDEERSATCWVVSRDDD